MVFFLLGYWRMQHTLDVTSRLRVLRVFNSLVCLLGKTQNWHKCALLSGEKRVGTKAFQNPLIKEITMDLKMKYLYRSDSTKILGRNHPTYMVVAANTCTIKTTSPCCSLRVKRKDEPCYPLEKHKTYQQQTAT